MNRSDKRPRDDGPPSLADAATALDAELRRFEELTQSAGKVPLDSQKNIQRAAKLSREASESRERFGGHLRALVEAVASARDRQQSAADALQACVDEIQSRSTRFEELLQRFAGLGSKAATIQERVKEAAALQKGADGMVASNGFAGVIEEVQDRLTEVVTEAGDLNRTATEEDFEDLARQADSLRQQVLAVRNRLTLLQRNLKTN